jgi:hypothetical protein
MKVEDLYDLDVHVRDLIDDAVAQQDDNDAWREGDFKRHLIDRVGWQRKLPGDPCLFTSKAYDLVYERLLNILGDRN